MANEDAAEPKSMGSPEGLSPQEDALRRYEARMKLLGIVLGTMVVGLAAVLIPAVINWTTLHLEDQRKKTELAVSIQQSHQAYIKEFLANGLNQDIELRLRFATYFMNLSNDGEDLQGWQHYHEILAKTRKENRDKINQLEAELWNLCNATKGNFEPIKIDYTRRELAWAYSEVGYAALGHSVVTIPPDDKERLRGELYRETRRVVERLAKGKINPGDADYIRFWALYRKDLIGIESFDVGSRMVTLGREIESLVKSQATPGDEYKAKMDDLFSAIDQELRDPKTQEVAAPLTCGAYIASAPK